MSIGKLIKKYREANELSMQEFADMTGLSKGYISMLEKGIHPQNGKEIIPSIETVSRIAKAMNTSIDALLEQTDKDQPVALKNAGNTTSPIYTAAAGEGRINDGYPTEECSFALEDDQFLFKIEGRSMEPTLLDGDLVVVAAQNVLDYSRQLALVKVNGEEQTIKRVEIKDNGLLLIGDNIDVYPPRFYTESEVKSLPVKIDGVVVKLVREIK